LSQGIADTGYPLFVGNEDGHGVWIEYPQKSGMEAD